MSDLLTTDGRWTPAGVRQRKALVASAEWLNQRGRSWVYFNGNTVLATIRRTGTAGRQSWIVHVHGHEFLVTPDMPSARVWPVGGYISVKTFPTAAEAKREVLRVLAQMPELETP